VRNPFSWDYLTAPANETEIWGPFSIAFALIFATGLFIAVFLNYDSNHRLKDRKLLYRTVQRATWIAIPIFGTGLVFFAFRILQVSAFGLHMRIWLYLCALAALIMVLFFWYYIRNVYPRLAAAEDAEARKRAYIERPAHGSSRGGKRKRAGKKRARTS
jgi:cytochrome bd-type quinol oxidase subunit 2